MGCTNGDPRGNVSVLLTTGEWINYSRDNSGLVNCQGDVILVDSSNNKWFGGTSISQDYPYQGVTKLAADGTWTNYNTTNSGLVDEWIPAIAEDVHGNMWFGSSNSGISVLTPTGNWIAYDMSNSDLLSNGIYDIISDSRGQLWILAASGLNVVSPEGTWETLLARDMFRATAVQEDGNAWLSAINWYEGDPARRVGLLHRNGGYVVSDDSRWLDALHWQATVDINSLVVRDDYIITVSGAKGADGLEIAPDSRYGLVVDYAGEITDRTPPPLPFVMAAGVQGDASTVQAKWAASDPESTITGYRYSIGSAQGATDIVNWTPISNTSLVRSGLGLVEGQRYWFVVQARNEGGLWSETGDSSFVSGRPFINHYLPLIYRR
jgi:hypothetical protein